MRCPWKRRGKAQLRIQEKGGKVNKQKQWDVADTDWQGGEKGSAGLYPGNNIWGMASKAFYF